MRTGSPGAGARRKALVDAPWSLLRQVHGADVVTVEGPGDRAGESGDGLVTACVGAPLAVLTADCAPVAFTSPQGVVGVAHAGWRGLLAGIVEATVEAMRALGAGEVEALLGPCIGPECYDFGAGDLRAVADRLGPSVVSQSCSGHPALDLAAAVRAACREAGARLLSVAADCTACAPGPRYWSWRARRDEQRQATVVWMP